MNKLNKCPFCGSSAYILKGNFLFTEAYGVICSKCGATSEPAFAGRFMNNTIVTSKEAAEKAVRLWNGTITH